MDFKEKRDDKKFESKFDLDNDSFSNKKLDRCKNCGDIYYYGVPVPHSCVSKNEIENNESKLNISIPSCGSKESNTDDLKSTVDISLFYNEIENIWKSKGCPYFNLISQDKKQNMPENIDESEKKEFSFNPYDNFF